jgi:hypothetical protein
LRDQHALIGVNQGAGNHEGQFDVSHAEQMRWGKEDSNGSSNRPKEFVNSIRAGIPPPQ